MPDTDYAIWTPKFDGDAPPNWHHSMSWCTSPHTKPFPSNMQPSWSAKVEYRVPPEALTTPFDYPTWAAQGRANRDKLPTGVAEALGPERDWADELARDYYNVACHGPVVLREFLRTRCRPIGNDTVTDEWLETRLHILKADIRYSFKDAVQTLRAIIAEATR